MALTDQGCLRVALQLKAWQRGSYPYDAEDANSFLTVSIPASQPPGSTLLLPVTVMARWVGLWHDTLRIAVEHVTDPPVIGRLEHVAGRATGTLDYRIAHEWEILPHRYRIDVEGVDWAQPRLRVYDETAAAVVASDVSFPDVLGHDFPVLDGWKLTSGSAYSKLLYDEQGERIAYDTLDVAWSAPGRAWFQPYQGYIYEGEHFFGSALRQYDLPPVRLIFDRTRGQKAYRWLRGGNPSYGPVGYDEISVRAYDISDDPPRQITLGYVENQPTADGDWNPVEHGDREYFFIFTDDYHESARAGYQSILTDVVDSLPCAYGMWVYRDSTKGMFEDGDSFTLLPRIPVSARDSYILDLTAMDVRSEPANVPYYTLHDSYPHPLRGDGVATIRFDTPRQGWTRLELFDLLGRRIRVLHDGVLPAGRHALTVDGGNLPAGTYLYVLTAEDTRLARRLLHLR